MATKTHHTHKHGYTQRLPVAILATFLLLSFTIDALNPVLETATLFPRNDTVEASIGQGYDFDDVTRRWVLVLHKGHGTGKLKLKYAHMSTVAFLEDNGVALAYQGSRSREGRKDQSIFVQISHDGGHNWSFPKAAVKSTRVPIWGPVLFSPSRENVAGSSDLPKLFLFYSRGATTTGCVGGTIEYVTSDDQGDTWSSPVIVHPFSASGGIPKTSANRVLVAADGGWLLPFWQTACKAAGGSGTNAAGVLRSTDQGKTWAVSHPIHGDQGNSTKIIESTLASLPDGDVLQLFRTKKKCLYQSLSASNGESWALPALPNRALVNPGTKVSLTNIPGSSDIILANNPVKLGRTPLTLSRSKDGGKTWEHLVTLEHLEHHWYAYPTVISKRDPSTGDVTLLTSYTVYQGHALIHRSAIFQGIRISTFTLPSESTGNNSNTNLIEQQR